MINTHSFWNENLLHAFQPTVQHVILFSSDTSNNFLCYILVPHTNFHKPQPTFQATRGKVCLTTLDEIYWIPEAIYHSSYWGTSGPCYLIAVWGRGPSGKIVPNTCLSIPGVDNERVSWNMKFSIFKPNWMIILYQNAKVFGIPKSM